MDHFVKFVNPPDDLEFPAGMRGRIYYDAEKQRLVCRGHMSKADYDHLRHLHRDPEHQRAIDELFRRAINGNDGAGGRRRLVLIAIVAGMAIVAAVVALIWFVARNGN